MLSPLLRRAISDARILTAAEAENLAPAARAGDGEAIAALVESVYRLLVPLILAYPETESFSHNDLFSEAVAVAARAARTFDPGKGAWTTHASQNVRLGLPRIVRKLSSRVHTPVDAPAAVVPSVASLDAETEDGNLVFEPTDDAGVSPDAPDFGSCVSMLSILSPRDHDILRRRFGFPPYAEPQILEIIGAAHGITRERARQIVEEALRKLRRWAKR